MKRRIKFFKNSLFALLLLTIPFYSFSQKGPGMVENEGMRKDRMQRLEDKIPNLSEEQKESIKAIHLSAMKDVKPLRNELGEKEAKFRTLQTQDNADMDAINNQIEEIAAIKTQIAKREAKAHQEVRALLNEDQKIVFDSHRGRRMEKARHSAHH